MFVATPLEYPTMSASSWQPVIDSSPLLPGFEGHWLAHGSTPLQFFSIARLASLQYFFSLSIYKNHDQSVELHFFS
jgi:hypothetical protein